MTILNVYEKNKALIESLFKADYVDFVEGLFLEDEDRPGGDTELNKEMKTVYWMIYSSNFKPQTTDDLLDIFYAETIAASKYSEELTFISEEGWFFFADAKEGVEDVKPFKIEESQRKKLFDDTIYPKVANYYQQAILASKKIDPVIKEIVKKWWSENSTNLFENFSKIAKLIADNNYTNATHFDIDGNNFNEGFFTELLEPTLDTSSGYGFVIEHFGFEDFLEENRDSGILGFFGDSLEEGNRNINGLQLMQKEEAEEFKNVTTEALELEEIELTEEEKLNLNQCALITELLHQGPYNFNKYFAQDLFKASPLSATKDGVNDGEQDRLYPVTIDNFNPTTLINRCTLNKKVKTIFETTDTKSPDGMIKGLFWVYEAKPKRDYDKNDDEFFETQDLREAELAISSKLYQNKLEKLLNKYPSGDAMEMLQKEKQDYHSRKSSFYYLENTKISYNGTNPSTARNDVKVTMTWKMGSLEGLDSTLTVLGEEDGVDEGTRVTIKDLITLPNTKKPNSSDGPGQFLTNQYSPNYSRVRLKVAAYGDLKSDLPAHKEDAMILDLAIIDHQIDRSSETGQTTLTITYRGYFEATMAMPFNDALADNKIQRERKKRQEEGLNKLMGEGCKPETIREALRLEQQNFTLEGKKFKTSSLLNRLMERALIHNYELDKDKLKFKTFGNRIDTRENFVKSVKPSPIQAFQLIEDAQKAVDNLNEEVAEGEGLSDFDFENQFFFLGDLMMVLTDCLYEDGSSKHESHVKNLNLRFLMGTINVPNPKNLNGPPLVINPVSIPIDVLFFIEWSNATIVKKGITSYPVGVFIRDLIERMVNNVIYDTCFSLLLPDENPPKLRTNFFTSSESKFFVKNSEGFFDPKDPYNEGAEQDVDLLFPKKILSDSYDKKSTIVNDTNYCVIYQQSPSYMRLLQAEQNKTLKEEEYTPTIFYGAKNTMNNFISNVSFSKTDSPYLREARYNNSDYGGLALLSNVYDLSFSFSKRKANTLFYPGSVFNFVLLDWGKRWDKTDTPYSDKSKSIGYGESDPHINGTMANIMGLGGYFIITSVEYDIGELTDEFEIKISAKYLGSDANRPLNRVTSENKNIEDNQECATAYNVIAERFNELNLEAQEEDPDANVQVAVLARTPETTEQRQTEAQAEEE